MTVFFTSHVVQDFFEQQYHYCRHFHQLFLAPLGLVGLVGRLVSGMMPPHWMENPGWGIYVGPNTYLANPDHRMQTWPPYADSTNVLGPKYRHLETCRDTFQVISIHVRQNPVEPICWFFGCCKKIALSVMWVWIWGWSQEPRKPWNSAMFIVQVCEVFWVNWWILLFCGVKQRIGTQRWPGYLHGLRVSSYDLIHPYARWKFFLLHDLNVCFWKFHLVQKVHPSKSSKIIIRIIR